jgi:hypothetical protein
MTSRHPPQRRPAPFFQSLSQLSGRSLRVPEAAVGRCVDAGRRAILRLGSREAMAWRHR